MILVTLTGTRRKLRFLIKMCLLLLLLAVVLPYIYGTMVASESMSDYQAEDQGIASENFPGEPIRVNGETWNNQSVYDDNIAVMLGVE